MKVIKDVVTDKERAFYGESDAKFLGCEFSGAADGESALKETRNIAVEDCRFLLRYPLWHTESAKIVRSVMAETCRAPLWYDRDVNIQNCEINGTKALRECEGVTLGLLKIKSDEFGWKCRDINIYDVSLVSSYPFFLTENVYAEKLDMTAKYSFQYVKNVVISNSYLDTKDAFWHSENVTVRNSVIKGEYLGWYSKGLTLENCKITGTQPLCYARDLKMINCETEGCDLSFERSTVDVEVKGGIVSVKNPVGRIVADDIGEIIKDEFARGDCEIIIRKR